MMSQTFNLLAKHCSAQRVFHRISVGGLTAVTFMVAGFVVVPANAQVTPIKTAPIFSDDFSGPQLDSAAWSLHSTAYGQHRTQYGNTPTTGKDADGTTFLSVPISSYNPNPGKAGVQFFGTEVMSRTKWPMGSGLEYEFRMRSKRLPSGLVLGVFAYGDYGKWTSTYQKTEIDYEFLTKQPGNKIWLNLWDDWNPERGGPRGDGLSEVPGLDWNNGGWNNYKIRWYPDRTEWIVNDSKIIRTDTKVHPGAPMGFWLNLWAPDAGWGDPYDSSLKTVSTPELNTVYSYDVDYVRVRPIPATKGVWGTGTGLTARYYDNSDFTGNMVMRNDHRINFDWGNYAPDTTLGVDSFSARWTGTVQAQYTEDYTFTTRCDDGVRLWVNNKLIIDDWAGHTATEKSAVVKLKAKTKYAIKLEYYDNTATAICQLSWSSPSTPKQIVPQSQLYPESVVAKPVLTPPGGSYPGPQNVKMTSATKGAVIRYTLDGTDPNALAPILETGKTLRVGASQLVRARAFVTGQVPSDITSAYYTIPKDTTAPKAIIVSPLQGSLYGVVPTISGTASDSATGSGIGKVTVQIRRLSDGLRWNGSSWINSDYGLQTVITAKSLPKDSSNVAWVCSGPFPTGANAPSDTYEIRASAYDVAGNISNPNDASAKVQIVLDALAPSVSFIYPMAGATVTTLNGTKGTAADQVLGSGMDRVALTIVRQSDGKQWNGKKWVVTPASIPTILGGADWSIVKTSTLPSGKNLLDGVYLLRATAYDKAGNSAVAERSVIKGSSAGVTAASSSSSALSF